VLIIAVYIVELVASDDVLGCGTMGVEDAMDDNFVGDIDVADATAMVCCR
jgi:hypothetical protein